MKAEEFIKQEKDKYGKMSYELSVAIDNVSPFIEREVLSSRKYVSRLPVLRKYIEYIEAAESEIGKSGFFGKFSSDSKYVDLLEGYKNDHQDDFLQLEKCSRCQCLNCTAECSFESCRGCREGAEIVECDHKSLNVTFYDDFTLNLLNERTGRDEKYAVLATMEDPQLKRKYIIIEGIYSNEKFILYYYPGISEDNYGEITDEAEFDRIVNTYETIER